MRVTPLCRPEQDFSRHSACGACCSARLSVCALFSLAANSMTDAWSFCFTYIVHTHSLQYACRYCTTNATRGQFSLILHASLSILSSRHVFFSPLHNTTWCRLCFVIQHLVHRVLCAIWAGSSCLLCLQVWHSTFAVYHKNAIKIIIETTYPLNKEKEQM